MALTETKPGLNITQLALTQRPRRLRTSQAMRDLVSETSVSAKNFIAPYFVVSGKNEVQPINALPGVSRLSVDKLMVEFERNLKLGIKATMLFGVIDVSQKTSDGKAATDENGPVASALREARVQFGNDLVLMTDVCLCGYTEHGHCGVLKPTPKGILVDNDSSLGGLATMALVHARAGADVVSPSDMMDGRIGMIRQTLDAEGFSDVSILSYAVKYASAFYGPFREAAGSSPTKNAMTHHDMMPPKDRKTYQMDFRNTREALRELELDEAEGADRVLVKPALAYLDVIAGVRAHTHLPVVAYNVSGEYAMLKAAASVGALDEALAVRESFLAMRRAGAELIISYHVVEALEKGWLDG
ncbi:MAG: porphobilinogen synthase [Trueperaceae bacterium]